MQRDPYARTLVATEADARGRRDRRRRVHELLLTGAERHNVATWLTGQRRSERTPAPLRPEPATGAGR